MAETIYQGPYTVEPYINQETILDTDHKYLTERIEVYRIQKTSEVNETGGLTVNLGEYGSSPTPPSPTPEYQQLTTEFGTIKSYPETIIDYEGSGETGIIIKVDFSGSASGIRVNNITRNESIILDSEKIRSVVGSYIQKYDSITINTNRGNKGIVLTRDGINYNILHARTNESQWIYLQTGQNRFTCTADSGLTNMEVRIEYSIKLLGV